MALPIDTIDGCGHSNEARRKLLPKKGGDVVHYTVKCRLKD